MNKIPTLKNILSTLPETSQSPQKDLAIFFNEIIENLEIILSHEKNGFHNLRHNLGFGSLPMSAQIIAVVIKEIFFDGPFPLSFIDQLAYKISKQIIKKDISRQQATHIHQMIVKTIKTFFACEVIPALIYTKSTACPIDFDAPPDYFNTFLSNIEELLKFNLIKNILPYVDARLINFEWCEKDFSQPQRKLNSSFFEIERLKTIPTLTSEERQAIQIIITNRQNHPNDLFNEVKIHTLEKKSISAKQILYRGVPINFYIPTLCRPTQKSDYKNGTSYLKTFFPPKPQQIIFSKESVFLNGLRIFFERVNIPYNIIDSEDPWVRDYLIETSSKNTGYHLYIRNKDDLADKAGFFYPSPLDNSQNKTWIDYTSNKPWINYTPVFDDQEARNINLYGMNIKSSNRLLEGGNLFACQNLAGDQYFIIGNNTIAAERRYFSKKGTIDLDRLENFATEKYAQLLGVSPDRIIIVENLTFHIDLQMCYLCPGIFLIHSMRALKNELPKFFEASSFDEDLIKKYDFYVDQIKQELNSFNFIVEEFCGTIYSPRNIIPHIPYHKKIWRTKYIQSTVINGLSATSKTQRYFITADTPIKEHKNYFINKIKYLCDLYGLPKIELVFLNIDENQVTDKPKPYNLAEATQAYIREYKGGIRCQTNVISK